MIVRTAADGATLLVGQTDHSRLVGQFEIQRDAVVALPQPFDSVARAAAFHDFGWLRYETAPLFDTASGETPSFRAIGTDATKLEEYQWCIDWFMGKDPYAGHIVGMHRTGLWRSRYGAMVHPPHPARTQPDIVEAFIAQHEERRAGELRDYGWDPQQMRINYRLLQVWDLLGLYFACQDPYDDYLDPVPTTATRLPVKSTGTAGHSPVWYDSPPNSSRPGTSGKYGMERTPVAATKWCARTTVPRKSVTVHSPVRSSNSAEVTRVSKRM